jgi:hypothetical protein
MSWSPLQREALEAMGLSPLQFISGVTPSDADLRSREAQPNTSAARPEASDRLSVALLRAAGGDRDAQTREAVLALCPSPQALRGDARAKRALWPRLRALRRH